MSSKQKKAKSRKGESKSTPKKSRLSFDDPNEAVRPGRIFDPITGRHLGQKYHPKHCQALLDWVSVDHNTLAGFATSIGVTMGSLYLWREKYKEFRKAMEIARQIILDFHDRNGSIATYGGKIAFHNAAWIARMRAQHGWDDNGPKDLEPDELIFETEDGSDAGENDDD